MINTTRILRDMCHAIGLYQPHSKSFRVERYRNGYCESAIIRPELRAARDAGMVSIHAPCVNVTDREYTRWSVTPRGTEWCWRYALAKPDRELVALEFGEVLMEAAP